MRGSNSARSDAAVDCSAWFSSVRRNWSAATTVGTMTAQLRSRDTSV
jgi:hypothetical protein